MRRLVDPYRHIADDESRDDAHDADALAAGPRTCPNGSVDGSSVLLGGCLNRENRQQSWTPVAIVLGSYRLAGWKPTAERMDGSVPGNSIQFSFPEIN